MTKGTVTVRGDKKVRLEEIATKQDGGIKREEADALREKLGAELAELQELLYAANGNGLLIVLQGMDTSGKDGTIRSAFGFLHPAGCRVASFKVPTAQEAAHDFLWRVHPQTPGRGEITVFNRSHYEDVLVVRVHELVKPEVWRSRYDRINDFERLLTESGTVVVKFFLHISKDEQKERLLAREQDPLKSWKLAVGDWQERERWDDYQAAYEDAIDHCATEKAPWHIIPADRKWFRDIAVLETLVETLRPYRKEWEALLKAVGDREKAALAAFRKSPDSKP